MLRQKPLRQRLLLIFAAGLLPVLLLGAWSLLDAVDAHRQEVERSTLELSRALASTVESELEATVRALAALSRAPQLASGDVEGFYAVTRDEVAARPDWLSMILTDAQGKVLFRTNQPYDGAEPRVVDPASLEKAIASGLPVIGNVASGPGQRPAFPVRLPIFAEGRLAYVLSAAVKPDRILEVVNKQQVPAGWVIAVFDAANQRVARSQEHQMRAPSPTLLALLARGGARGTGITYSLEGAEVQTGFARVDEAGWTVAVGAPTAIVRAALVHSLTWYVLGAAASVLLCLGLALRITARIGRDITALGNQATALGEGRAVVVERSDIAEVDQMAQALQAASERLGGTTDSLREAVERATAAGRAKDEFLAVLGHELRNPLAPMLTALHLMDLKCDETTAQERAILRRQMAHMRRLVDDLLDLSRITRGMLEIRREPVNLVDVVEHALEAVQPALERRSRGLRLDLPSRPARVSGDESRLLQVVTNLLHNAIAFAGTGAISVSLRKHEGNAVLVVRDEGVGMTPETLAQVFDSFYQAEQSSDRAPGGLGLGLAIVKTIVELHGGTVRAESEGPGRGSTFTVSLPLDVSTVAPSEPVPQRREREPAGPARVLLVDDNVDALQTVAAVLQSAGHEVRSATRPSDAIEAFRGFEPDVAILDIGLPEMDGYALAEALRRAEPGWRGKLVALTGYSQERDRARAAEAGFALHLSKPAEPRVLLEALETLRS